MSPAQLLLLQNEQTPFVQPRYFLPVILGLFATGAIVSLVAAVLGFARARAFGAPVRWFAFAAVCLLLFHIQFLVLGFGVVLKDDEMAWTILTFFNVFVILAAVCAAIGFVRLTSPRSPVPPPPVRE